jgi:hypothetical protein
MAAAGFFCHDGVVGCSGGSEPVLGAIAVSRIQLGFTRFSRAIGAGRDDVDKLDTVVASVAQRGLSPSTGAAVDAATEGLASPDRRLSIDLRGGFHDLAS